MTVLEIEGLAVDRGGFPVLTDLNLAVDEGELVAVLGRNGAGKTTLVETIAGLLKSRAGTLRLGGSAIENAAAHEIARQGVALVPEGRRLFPSMTVLENLAVGAHATPWWWRRPPAGTLDFVWSLFPDLWELRNRPVRVLSGGQLQMVAIGRALVSSPRLLILDEPSFGLSPQMVEASCAKLVALREEGVSVLLVEQNVDVALDVCTRAALLADGRIVADGQLADLIGTPGFGEAMFGIVDPGSPDAETSSATTSPGRP